jgi:ADP-ribosylglycohydrolase
MRASPIGIWGAGQSANVVAEAARAEARLTHPHPVCQDASAVFTVAIAHAIQLGAGAREPYEAASGWAQTVGLEPAVLKALRAAEREPPADYHTQQGWVLVALQNACYQLLHAPSLEAGVVSTVRAGGDTDTNAAICGALLGAVYGREAVPAQWRQMVLSCRPTDNPLTARYPRPRTFWPTDLLVLAERLLITSNQRPVVAQDAAAP